MKTQSKRPRSDGGDQSKVERVAKKAATTSAASASSSPSASTPSTKVSKKVNAGQKPNAEKPSTANTSTTTTAAPPQPCKNALLVVSTYHAVMAGLVYKKDKFYIKFSVKRHVGRVNGTAVTPRYIASCGVDERVFLFTNKAEERLTAAARKKMHDAGEPLAIRLADLGSLTPPAEVTALAFADGSQTLLCGCGDGQLLLYRCRDWSLATALTVHEKAVVGLAVHPGSHGTLAVTIGDDRAIAVLDLVKGKLLTKWKYNPQLPSSASGAGTDTTGGAEEGRDGPAAPPAALKSIFAPLRETPVNVFFSPLGTRLVVFSRFSFVVYDAAVMQPLCTFRCANPQPPEELHCCAFYGESVLVLGTEAGVLRQFCVTGTTKEPAQVVGELVKVTVTYPDAVAAQAAALLATPVKVETETRQKNPLRHVNRIKALQVQGSTIFSIDSSGIVIAWNAQPEAAGAAAAPLHVQYVTSANCQGRVTDMELYQL